MRLRFQWVREDRPGRWWAGHFARTWPAYRRWFLLQGDAARPDLATCRAALGRHMPELVPTWERLVELADGDEQAARMLSLYRPTPYLSGCSQAARGGARPVLVRNYDYHPESTEGTFLRSAWSGAGVVASSDCLWGALDGVNAHGLAVALSFGGRKVVGEGFGIPLVLRYVLETCASVAPAVEALARVPSHMTYNVSLLDAAGARAVVGVAPDRPAAVLDDGVATNHLGEVEWSDYARQTESVARAELLREHVDDAGTSDEALTELFLRPPLYRSDFARSSGTLYTAAFRPATGEVSYRWPAARVDVSVGEFEERSIEVRVGQAEGRGGG